MKCWWAVLFLCLCGSTLGIIESQPRPTTNSTTSRIQQEGKPEHIKQKLLLVFQTCGGPLESGLKNVTRVDGSGQVDVSDLCATLPGIHQCLSEQETQWKETHSEALNKVFQIYRELWETNTGRLCDNQGEKLTAILQQFRRIKRELLAEADRFVAECVVIGVLGLNMVDKSKARVATKLWYHYHHLQNFEDCFTRTLSKYEDFAPLIVEQIHAVLEDMKCLHPLDESLVSCKSLDSSLIDRDGMCFITERFPDQDVHGLLVSRLFRCVELKTWYVGPVLSEAQNIEQFQTFFTNYCRLQAVNFCFYENLMAADICLDEASFKMFELVKFYLEVVFNAGCLEEGGRLATVFSTVHEVFNETSERERLLQCLGPNLGGADRPKDVYRYYQALPDIKQCLLGAAPGNTAYDTAVAGIIQEVSDKAKCLNAQDGSVRLCKTILNN